MTTTTSTTTTTTAGTSGEPRRGRRGASAASARTHGRGTLERVAGLNVLRLAGSFEEMGEQHGALLAEEIRRGPIPYYRTYVERLLGKSAPGAGALLVAALERSVGAQVRRAMPDFAKDTIRGVARGAGLPEEDFLRGCTMPDTLLWVASRLMELKAPGPAVVHRLSLGLGCTSAIAWGAATKDGKLLHARNLDYHGVGCWPQTASVLFHAPDEGQRYVSVSAAGVALGGVTAMNEAGLTLTVHQHMFTDRARLGGTPIGVVGDVVMRTARSLDEAEAILRAHTPIGCWTYLVTDGKTREVLCFEESPDRKSARRVGGAGSERDTFGYANVYLDEELGRTEVNLYGSYWRHNEARHRAANASLAAQRGALDAPAMAGILGHRGRRDCRISEATGMVMTVGSVVFSPEDAIVWVGTGEAPTSRNEWVAFDLRTGAVAEGRPSFRVEDGEREDEREAFARYRAAYVRYLDHDDAAGAAAAMDEACALAPEEPLYHFLRGLLALSAGDAAMAVSALDRALALGHAHEERRAGFHLWRARAADRLERRDEALAHYRRALALRADPPVHAAARKGFARPWRGGRWAIDFSMADVVTP